MIKAINGGRYVSVKDGNPTTPYVPPGGICAGMVRWNQNTSNMEVNDGVSWKQFDPVYPTIDLNSDAQDLLDWVRLKRNEEIAIKNLAKENPAVQIALDNLNKAKEQLEITIHLSKDYEKTTS